ncbi:MAG TPA: AsmA family protein, partial [Acidobacteriaceae bacterium]|nr:AsmA family protein [Acidobacteriaceae bacterium]
RRQRRVLWAVVLIAVLLILALTPPLLNVGRYQRRILSSMSQSLGRPVHLDSVQLHLLPVPGFTISNLVVSEDPAFGDEPTIRANTVVAQLRISSLWKRRVEFSRVLFQNPSVNLVRNANGRWNLESVLLHASQVDTAPTAQQQAGPAPRFPYIEATGGRINIKLGEEKMPFALTEADFALWLPSPQVWRVRLVGKPTRTDSNIGDPGIMRLEGSLQRAANMGDVPVNLQASWHDAPLGEASRLVTGDDRGWRGTLHADASLQGPLAAAVLRTNITLDDLRRADFVPSRSLDVSLKCSSTADLPAASLRDVSCLIPTDEGKPPIQLTAASVDLANPFQAPADLEAEKLPVRWVFGWARLFSPRIPSSNVPGTLDAVIDHAGGSSPSPWSGTVGLTLAGTLHRSNGELLTPKAEAETPPQGFAASLTSTGNNWQLVLPPTPLRLGPSAELTVSAQASPAGYSFTANGNASPAQIAAIAHALPQLGDGAATTATTTASANTVGPVALSCSRSWSGGQSCGTIQPPAPPARRPTKRHRTR